MTLWPVKPPPALPLVVAALCLTASILDNGATASQHAETQGTVSMTTEERRMLKDEARDMFYHAYNAYMDNAFPADELMPLSCRGRYRGREPDRGDLDEAMGNFSVSLIDALDTLVLLGDLDEFEKGCRLVIDNVEFDSDIVVSVFETNIRVVGGLMAAHILAQYVRDRYEGRLSWYQGELLNMAQDVGYRLLPAFNSSTGLPHPRVNLRHGLKSSKIRQVGETCTACAGTMILEMAALSRLSGEPIFEEKASHAMDVLWSSRHRMSNLVGNVLNVNTGDWVRRDSGVGAGIDSYYEYVAKAYILLGDEKYLGRWQTHYAAVMKYLGQGPLLTDVHMHRPHSNSKHFVDALGAFWPGLQVLMGDVKSAIETHEILYQVMDRHHFIPEAFTTDYQVHWGQYLLRPEFIESTYFLFKATGDPHYLDVGKKALRALQKYARVPCGYATIKDVRTLQKEDRLDSFVLAETFKYLYLLFADESDLILDLNNWLFTTEGHLMPLSLARLSNRTAVPLKPGAGQDDVFDEDVDFARACPSPEYLFPTRSREYAGDVRAPLANHVAQKCPVKRLAKRSLLAADFNSGNADHLEYIKRMGIAVVQLPDGRVQMVLNAGQAATPADAEEGVLFMQEMIDLSKQQPQQPETPLKLLKFSKGDGKTTYLMAGPAQFGEQLEAGLSVTSSVVVSEPKNACTTPLNGQAFFGKIVIVERGDCMFIEKARNIQALGAKGGIVMDNVPSSSINDSPMFAMSGDGTDDVSIPMLFLFDRDAKALFKALSENQELVVTMQESFRKESGEISDAPSNVDGEAKDTFDFTAPVRSFLEKSRKQVEHYFSGTQDPVESSYAEKNANKGDEIKDSDTEEITIRHEEGGDIIATSTQTIKDPDGTVRKVYKVERLREDAKGSVTVETLSDEDVERLLDQHKSEKSEEGPEGKNHFVGNGGTDDVSANPSEDDEDANLFHVGRIDHIFDLFEPKHNAAGPLTADLIKMKNPNNFIEADVKVLVGLFVQVMYEEVQADQTDGVQMVLTLVSEFGSLDLASKIDQDIGRFVDRALSATGDEDALLKHAAAIVEAALDRRRPQERLQDFLQRILAQAQVQLPPGSAEMAKRYLAVNPVLVNLFASLKERALALSVSRKAEESEKRSEL